MGKWGMFLIIVCCLLSAASLIFAVISSLNEPAMAFYFLAGGVGGFILFASLGTILNMQLSNARSIERLGDLLSEKIKQDVTKIECKICFKKYDAVLKTCPHCGAKT
jgi:hypothetical protein